MGLITENNKVIDTNILIYHLNDGLKDNVEYFLRQALEANSYISVITRIELFGWAKHTDESLHKTKVLLNTLSEQPLTEEIIQLCIKIRQTVSIKMPDAIIAATALHLKLPLMTRNIDDFQKISSLQLFNPFESNE